ncbi:hypothetical protein IP70_21395 [alpha proteobacterium AAP38]|nr:hypothetical protein IP70_21395 [alpha proteobacterium AAP38]
MMRPARLTRPTCSLLSAAALSLLLSLPVAAAPTLTVSREVGLPLQAAKEALAANRFDAALAAIDKAAAVPTITAEEKWAVEQTRAAIFKAQGRFDKAAIAFEAATSLVPLSAADQAGALETLSQLWYRAGNYAKSAEFGEKAMAAGRLSDAFRQMVAEAYFRAKEPAKAGKLAQALIEDQRKAGRAPSAEVLQLQAASEFGSGNIEGYIKTLKQQLRTDRSKENWLRLFNAMQQAKPVPEKLDLDWARLRLAANAYENPDSFTEMAQRAMVEELPAEAAAVLERGWSLGILGKGPKQDRHERLRDYATRQLAAQKDGLTARQQEVAASKDANSMAKLGMILVSLGQTDQGIAMMQQALKGKLLSPNVVRLRLGMVQYRVGQTKAAAQTMAALPQGSDEARLAEVGALLYPAAN